MAVTVVTDGLVSGPQVQASIAADACRALRAMPMEILIKLAAPLLLGLALLAVRNRVKR